MMNREQSERGGGTAQAAKSRSDSDLRSKQCLPIFYASKVVPTSNLLRRRSTSPDQHDMASRSVRDATKGKEALPMRGASFPFSFLLGFQLCYWSNVRAA